MATLLCSCALLGVGVAMTLSARWGSDGYSSLISGLARSTHAPYAGLNAGLGLSLVALAWLRGVKPGIGTLVQPAVVGVSVSAVLSVGLAPDGLIVRSGCFVIGLCLLSVGIAGYLRTELGKAPLEAAAAAARPLSFRMAYSCLQASGAFFGWILGADVGVGTVLVFVAVGPMVAILLPPSRPASS